MLRYLLIYILADIASCSIVNKGNNDCRLIQGLECERKNIGSNDTISRSVCNERDIPSNVKFTVMLNENSTSSPGVLTVNFTPLAIECQYRVTLLVNSSINNKKDCAKHNFYRPHIAEKEVHSVERTVCVSPQYSNATNTGYAIASRNVTCQENVTLWYEHIYTGCYALSFDVGNNKYVSRGNKFIVTNYQRSDIEQPKFRCNYSPVTSVSLNEDAIVFSMSISVLASATSLVLSLTPIPEIHGDKEDACARFSDLPLYLWKIDMIEKNFTTSNCSITMDESGSDELVRTVECGFQFTSPGNLDYCLTIGLIDERCHKHTTWNPPPNKQFPCAWMQKCTKLPGSSIVIEYNKKENEGLAGFNGYILLPVIFFVLLITLTIWCGIIYGYCVHLHNGKRFFRINTYTGDLKFTSATRMDEFEVNEMNRANCRKELEKKKLHVVLMYIRGSPAFENQMAELRNALSQLSNCVVHDWHAAEEWDSVAKLGCSDWFVQLLKKDCPIVWVDTPRIRSVVNKFSPFVEDAERSSAPDDVICDFRDMAFPVVLNLAKRSIQNNGTQYRRHFVVRVEGYQVENGFNDPFAELSPSTRFVVPTHLSQLCSHLASSESNVLHMDE